MGDVSPRRSSPLLRESFRVGDSVMAEQDSLFSPYGTGWHLNRCRFDRMLARAATEAGSDVIYRDKIGKLSSSPDGLWSFALANAGGPYRTRFLVIATGRGGTFPAQWGVRRLSQDKLVCAIRYARSRAPLDQDLFTLTEAVETGWWYSARLPDNRLVLAFFTDSDLAPSIGQMGIAEWTERLQATRFTKLRLASLMHSPADPLVRPANSYVADNLFGDRWVLVGDSAAAYDPLSSFGIQKALSDSYAAAYAVQHYLHTGSSDQLQNYASQAYLAAISIIWINAR